MLFEVIVALTVLGLIGAGWLGAIGEIARDLQTTREREQETREASRQLRRMMLWREEDFDLYVGSRRSGSLAITIVRTSPSLYAVDMSDAVTRASILRTTLYVPPPPDTTRAAP
jgi:hypothetical protein